MESANLNAPIDPLDFFDFLRLEDVAALAFTYSGGVQEGTSILGASFVTLCYSTERPETVFVGRNFVAWEHPVDIVAADIMIRGKDGDWDVPCGDGRDAAHILDALPISTVERQVEVVE